MFHGVLHESYMKIYTWFTYLSCRDFASWDHEVASEFLPVGCKLKETNQLLAALCGRFQHVGNDIIGMAAYCMNTEYQHEHLNWAYHVKIC